MIKKKIKLCISSINLDYGGIEKSLVNLINSLDKNKYDITLFLEEKKGVFLNDIKDIRTLEYKPSKKKLINMFKRIIFYLKNKNKYDVSICYGTYSLAANMISRVASNKRIFYIHSNYYELYDRDIEQVKLFFNKRNINDFNKIVFVSNESKNDLIKIFPEIEEKSFVINNIVDVENIIKYSKEDCEIELNNNNLGIFVGRLDAVKQIDVILDLANKCKKGNKNIGFLIIGDGSEKEKLLKIKNDLNLDNVLFLGPKDNPYKYIRKSNFLILTSKYEGYPVVYNEAIVLNKPILTTLNITDDQIAIDNGFGIISSKEDLYDNLNKIVKYKNKKIDFEDVNNKRIKCVDNLIKDLYEEK